VQLDCLLFSLYAVRPGAVFRAPIGDGDSQYEVVMRTYADGKGHVADGGEVNAEVPYFRILELAMHFR